MLEFIVADGNASPFKKNYILYKERGKQETRGTIGREADQLATSFSSGSPKKSIFKKKWRKLQGKPRPLLSSAIIQNRFLPYHQWPICLSSW